MNRYVFKVADISRYNRPALIDELRAAKIPIANIHMGNGGLIFDAEIELDFALKTALATTIANHKPVWFEWSVGKHTFRRVVRNVEDMNRVTASRIRGLIGGDDPMQEQLKMLREFVTALDAKQNPAIYDPRQIAAAGRIREKTRTINKRIEAIKQEGKAFKRSKGWEV